MKQLKPLGYERLKVFYFLAALIGLLASALSIYVSIHSILDLNKKKEGENG